MPTHDEYPGFIPDVRFSGEQIRYLEGFTIALLQAVSSRQDIEQLLNSAVVDVRLAGDDSLKLTVLAEAAGATRIPGKDVDLLELLRHHPLLDESDRQVLVGINNHAWDRRSRGASEEQVIATIGQQIGEELVRVDRLETESANKSACKLALLAYRAGASLHQLDYASRDQLLGEVGKFSER